MQGMLVTIAKVQGEEPDSFFDSLAAKANEAKEAKDDKVGVWGAVEVPVFYFPTPSSSLCNSKGLAAA